MEIQVQIQIRHRRRAESNGSSVMERVGTGDVRPCKKEPTVRAVLLLRGNGNRGGCRDPLVQTEEKIRLEHQAENHLGHE